MRAFLIENDAFKTRRDRHTATLRSTSISTITREGALSRRHQANISGLERTGMIGIDHMIIGIDGLRAGLACERIQWRNFDPAKKLQSVRIIRLEL